MPQGWRLPPTGQVLAMKGFWLSAGEASLWLLPFCATAAGSPAAVVVRGKQGEGKKVNFCSARSLGAQPVSRSTWVVLTLSCPSQSTITVTSTGRELRLKVPASASQAPTQSQRHLVSHTHLTSDSALLVCAYDSAAERSETL